MFHLALWVMVGFFFFGSGRWFYSRLFRLGEWLVFFCVVGGVILVGFSLFFIRHAPFGRVLCRGPPLLPVTPVAGVRLVACTRQRGFCSLARVTVTLRHFLVLHGGEGAYGGCSSAGWYWCRRVFPTRRRYWRNPPVSSASTRL